MRLTVFRHGAAVLNWQLIFLMFFLDKIMTICCRCQFCQMRIYRHNSLTHMWLGRQLLGQTESLGSHYSEPRDLRNWTRETFNTMWVRNAADRQAFQSRLEAVLLFFLIDMLRSGFQIVSQYMYVSKSVNVSVCCLNLIYSCAPALSGC